jgi:hypothetical protein
VQGSLKDSELRKFRKDKVFKPVEGQRRDAAIGSS